MLSIIVYILPATVASGIGLGAFNASQVGTKRPSKNSSGESINQLFDSFSNRVDDIAPGRDPLVGVIQNTPPADESLLKTMKDTLPYASNASRNSGDGFDIRINPNADRAYFAHELGHVASAQTPVGGMIRNARHNPALTRSLAGAAILGAGSSAALTAGDDDLATSVALAYAGAIPEIADEFLASKNALAIMDGAGMRANLGQKGRLAGGLLSYLGAPLLLGATANYAGNMVDEEPKSPGELPVS